MTDRVRVQTGAPWEDIVGYSRAVRVGSLVTVSGTAPVDDNGGVYARGDAYRQAKRCIDIIEQALQQAGAELSDVVRTRIFVTDISKWSEIGRAHSEAFDAVRPATSMVEVTALIDPDMLVEIEAEAIIDAD